MLYDASTADVKPEVKKYIIGRTIRLNGMIPQQQFNDYSDLHSY